MIRGAAIAPAADAIIMAAVRRDSFLDIAFPIIGTAFAVFVVLVARHRPGARKLRARRFAVSRR
jgi:hypothetical protein